MIIAHNDIQIKALDKDKNSDSSFGINKSESNNNSVEMQLLQAPSIRLQKHLSPSTGESCYKTGLTNQSK